MEYAKTKMEKLREDVEKFNNRIKETYTAEEIIEMIKEKVKELNIKKKYIKYLIVTNKLTVPKAYGGTKEFMGFEATFCVNGNIKKIKIYEDGSQTTKYGGGMKVCATMEYTNIFKICGIHPTTNFSRDIAKYLEGGILNGKI